ncbi:MAG TPA: DUF417 family protein [Methylomirabilota bacterium]|nr:DUF417 family protein [Methylomirabilota bacterium]
MRRAAGFTAPRRMVGQRPLWPRIPAIGSGLAVIMLLTTLSPLISTPDIWEPSLGGFPAPGAAAAFLLRDLVLLGAALWWLGESLGAPCTPRGRRPVA